MFCARDTGFGASGSGEDENPCKNTPKPNLTISDCPLGTEKS